MLGLSLRANPPCSEVAMRSSSALVHSGSRAATVGIGILSLLVAPAQGAELDRFEGLANLPFENNRPTPETAEALKEELHFQRATQTYLWAMPLINTLGMKVGAEEAFGTGYNVMPVWT